MIVIPKFTAVESTRAGLTCITELRMEREAWGDPDQTYPDVFYKEWLPSRIDTWSDMSYAHQQLNVDLP